MQFTNVINSLLPLCDTVAREGYKMEIIVKLKGDETLKDL
jgi:hypothetical protein